MIYEKIFRHAVGREAKVIVKGEKARYSNNIVVELEFLVKDTHDLNFHQPIGKNHPQYWKLKKAPLSEPIIFSLNTAAFPEKKFWKRLKNLN